MGKHSVLLIYQIIGSSASTILLFPGVGGLLNSVSVATLVNHAPFPLLNQLCERLVSQS